jgi:hypothetical protein
MPKIFNRVKNLTRRVFGLKNTKVHPERHVNNSAVKVSSKTPSVKKTAKKNKQPNVNGAYFNPNTWNTFDTMDTKVKEMARIAKQELNERRANPSAESMRRELASIKALKKARAITRKNNENEIKALREGKATSLAAVPNGIKYRTMNNILRNLGPAVTAKSKALQNRLTRKRKNVKTFELNPFNIYQPVKPEPAAAAAVAVQAAEAAEAASATAQQAAVVATQGTPEGRYYRNLANINFSEPEKPRPNIGKLFTEFEANKWVKQGRAANLGRNFNVFGYEPVRAPSAAERPWNWQHNIPPLASPAAKLDSNNNEFGEFVSAPPRVKADPLAALNKNWDPYTIESMPRRNANAKAEIARKREENNAKRHAALISRGLST